MIPEKEPILHRPDIIIDGRPIYYGKSINKTQKRLIEFNIKDPVKAKAWPIIHNLPDRDGTVGVDSVRYRLLREHLKKHTELKPMGKDLYCDFCRGSVPIDSNMQPVAIGDDKIGDACITCASQLGTGLKKQIAEMEMKFKEALKAPSAAAVPEAPVAPAPAETIDTAPAPAAPANEGPAPAGQQ